MNNGHPNYDASGTWKNAMGQQGYAPGQAQQPYAAYQQNQSMAGRQAYPQANPNMTAGNYAGYQMNQTMGGYAAYQQNQSIQPQAAYPQAQPGSYQMNQPMQGGYAPQQAQPMMPPAGYPLNQSMTGGYQGYQQPMQGGYAPQQAQQPVQQQVPPQPYRQQQAYQQPVQPQRAANRPMQAFGKNFGMLQMILMCGVAPVLFLITLLCTMAGGPVLTAMGIIFIVVALAAVGFAWLKQDLPVNTRVTLSVLLALAMVVTVVAMVPKKTGSSITPSNTPAPTTDPYAGSYGGQQTTNQQQYLQDPYEPSNPGPMEPVTNNSLQNNNVPTTAGEILATSCGQQLQSFFSFWQANDTANMVAVTTPSWQRSAADAKTELFRILANRRAVEWEPISITGTDDDAIRTVYTKVVVNKQNGSANATYMYNIVMKKEDGIWYVDPLSLSSNEEVTVQATNSMPTQPPSPAPAGSNTILYYNPDGGSFYHADPNCSKVGSKYRPLTASFPYSDLTTVHTKLQPCTNCGSPVRPK